MQIRGGMLSVIMLCMKYVAFLRGINVGGRTIGMADLKLCFENLGFQDVATVLQTGNVVFESYESSFTLKETIEAGLSKTFDYSAHVQVIPVESLRSIIDSYPFKRSDPVCHDYIVFFEGGLERQLAQSVVINTDIEQCLVGAGVIYWRVPKGLTLKSSFAKYLTKSPYKNSHTNRNIRTLQKIVS